MIESASVSTREAVAGRMAGAVGKRLPAAIERHTKRVLGWLRTGMPRIGAAARGIRDGVLAITHWQVGARLGLGFAMVLLWSLVILFLALGRMARMEATVSQVTGIEWQRMLRVSEIESQAQAVTANDMRRDRKGTRLNSSH